jgi:6,7-dimethyl-8-ribityllumazine synthase
METFDTDVLALAGISFGLAAFRIMVSKGIITSEEAKQAISVEETRHRNAPKTTTDANIRCARLLADLAQSL